jgi:hypothetical protein
MKLPIIVVITSSVPDRTRSSPGHSAQSAPPSMPDTRQSGTTMGAGAPRISSAATAAKMAPM